ncbi:MAG: glucosyltransferase domain-containing protein [Eubacteriales bacterium]|nr:glucosyltransferase domain-containing protein [Eubacteriales bacterium]
MEQRKPFLLERCLGWLWDQVRDNKAPLTASLILGWLAYGFTFANKLINHDEVYNLFSSGATFSSGRWGLEIMERIFPQVSMPWVYGILSVTMAAVAACMVCRMFHVRSRLLQCLLAGSITVFPAMTSTLTYLFTSAPYLAAFLLSVGAVYLLKKPTVWSSLFALGFLVLSLSCYQAYVAVAAGLLVVVLIQELLEGAEVKKVLKKGVFYLVFLVLSLIFYMIATQLVNRLTGHSFSSYAGENMDLSLGDIPGKLAAAYHSFLLFFTQGYQGIMTTALSRWMHALVLGAMAVFLLLWSRENRDWGRMALVAALTALLPLAMNCMYLFSAEDAVHTLVLYGFVAFYALAVVLAEVGLPLLPASALGRILGRLALEGTALAMALILSVNVYTANAASLALHLRYENAYAFYTALAADIQLQPGFDENTKLAICGQYQSPAFYYDHFREVNNLQGTVGFFPDNYSKNRFVEYYIGFPIPFATDEETQAIKSTAAYAAMPVYPYYGSMQMIGDVLVVKLS